MGKGGVGRQGSREAIMRKGGGRQTHKEGRREEGW